VSDVTGSKVEVLFLAHTNMQVTLAKFPKTHYLDLKVCNLP